MSRHGKLLLRGGGSRFAAFGATSLIQLFMVPFVLGNLGESDFGLWALVGAVTGYYGMFDLGVSSAISRFVSRELGKGDSKSASDYLGAGRTFYRKVAVWLFVVTLGVAIVGYFFWEDREAATKFSSLILIMGSSVALSFPFACYTGALTAEMRYDVISLIGLVGAIVRAVLVVAVLKSGGGVVGLALASAGLRVAESIVIRAIARRIASTQPADGPASNAVWSEIFTYSKQTLVSKVADLFRFKIHPVTVSAFMQLSDVAMFSLHERIFGVVAKCVSTFFSMLSPVFSRLDGAGNLDQLKKAYFFTYKISCYFVTFLLLELFLSCSDLLTVWLGKEYPLVATLIKIRIVGALCSMIQMPSVSLFYGTSKNGDYAITNSVHSVLTVSLTLLGIWQWGLEGLLWGLVIPTIFVKTILQPRTVAQHFGISLIKYHLSATIPNLARLIPCYALIWWIGEELIETTWISIITFGSISAALFLPYILWIGFDASERSKLRAAIRKN